MSKKLIAILVTSSLLFVFAGCLSGNSSDDDSTANIVDTNEEENIWTDEEYPYLSYGITVSSPNGKDVLYYNGERVRLLVDYKENSSFHLFFVDREGTADLQAIRNAQGNLTGISTLSSTQAQEFLRVLEITEGSSSGNTAIPEGRISKDDLTADLLAWVNNMDQNGGGIYIIKYEDRFIVYCNDIPGQYAWQPSYGSNTTVAISDLDPNGDGYALLNLPLCDNLTVSYRGASLSVSQDTAMQLIPTI